MTKKISIILFFAILTLAAFFRFYGVNWDQNQHLHPDERFLTMVTGGISWPNNFSEYLNTPASPLNPQNRGFGFFVYGTFPVFFTKYMADITKSADYNGITIIGRKLSGAVDLGTVILIFMIAGQLIKFSSEKLNSDKRRLTSFIPYFAMFFYSSLVLPIQLAHYYAVDSYLIFFITLSFFFLVRTLKIPPGINSAISITKYLIFNAVFLGISMGLAAASKISAVLFLPVVALGFIFVFFKIRNFIKFLLICLVFSVVCIFTFRLAQPYAFNNPNVLDFTINQNFIESLKTLKSFDGPQTSFPPALQWIPTTPYIYPFVHLVLWGMGLPFSLLFIVSNLLILFNKSSYKNLILLLSLSWIILLFGYQAGQFAKALRYFAPILPSITLLTAYSLTKFTPRFREKTRLRIILPTVIFACLIYPLSFLSIYTKPHSRVTASSWIYQNIPPRKTIAVEHWDDGLPLTLNALQNNGLYAFITLPLYNPDSPEKWREILPLIQNSDYIILTSNRLWRSLSALPQRFPQTARYYQALFSGKLGFKQIAVFSSYPCLIPQRYNFDKVNMEKTDLTPPVISIVKTPYCLLALNDDGAEESFTVYDHPKVIIFQKTADFSQENFIRLIGN